MKDSGERRNTAAPCWSPAQDFDLLSRAAPDVARPTVVLALSAPGSPPRESLQRARAVADAAGGALHLVRVLPGRSHGAAVLSDGNLTDILQSVEQTLTAHRATRAWMKDTLPDGQGVERLAILHGEFVESVTVYAREVDAGLILVCPEGEHAGRLVTRLAATTRTPVLAARAPARNQTIVAATDLRDPTYPVLQLAAALGQQLETSVIVVHNVRLGATPNEATAASAGETRVDAAQAERLARLRQASGLLPMASRTAVRHEDDPVDAILLAAREEEADLVVVGTRAPAWFERGGGADVAARIVDRARRSVLVTPVNVSATPLEFEWG